MNKDKWLPILKKVLKILAISTCGTLLVALGAGILLLNQKPDLSVWHKSHLDEEFTARSLKGRNPVDTFGDYLALEDRLFQQLEKKIYDQIEPEEKTVLNRFHRGSLSDPGRWPTNWNRSFEWEPRLPTAGGPRGSVLLIHGLSDSPYSLRTLGKRLQEEGYHVLGLRVPGHGTAPSGLARTKWQDMAAAVVWR